MKKHQLEQFLKENMAFEPITKPTFELDLAPLSSAVVFPPWKRILIATFSFFFLALSGVYFNLRYQVESVVSVDFNPSFDLKVNYFGEVIGYDAQNSDAEQLQNQLPKHPLSPAQAIEELYQLSIEKGFVSTNQANVFLIGFHESSPTQSTRFVASLEEANQSSIFFLFLSDSSVSTSTRFYKVQTTTPEFSGTENVDSYQPSYQETPETEIDRHNLLTKPLRQLTPSERVALANSLEISYAKLSLIIEILIFENKTEDLTRFFEYVRSNINSLALRLPR